MMNIVNLKEVSLQDIANIGGKNAGLGEMIQHLSVAGVTVPGGFATTADAYRAYLAQNHLDKEIFDLLADLDDTDIATLKRVGAEIRQKILAQDFTPDFVDAVSTAYAELGQDVKVAVRSSATAEDLPGASFAGQQQTVLNVVGINNVLIAMKTVFASLYTDRAITYRNRHGFAHEKVAMSVGVQRMVQSEDAVSGVMFTLDTESGFNQVVLINAAYGLGEGIVSGKINPDEFCVYKPGLISGKAAILKRHLGSKEFKQISGTTLGELQSIPMTETQQRVFCLNDEEITLLAQYAVKIENHYGVPMDIEWAKDSIDGQFYIVQARPETIQSQGALYRRYELEGKAEVIITGRSVGETIGQGVARVISNTNQMNELKTGEILVTDMTNPDWEPVMTRAAAIVTNRGGRTCHAAIVARELGIPAVIGCEIATQKIQTGESVTVSCAQGDIGYVYRGIVPFKVEEIELREMPKLPVEVCMNLGNPERAFQFQKLPNDGVGLARLEFIISQSIGVHPNACLAFDQLSATIRDEIAKLTTAYSSPTEFYIAKLAEGLSTIAAAFAPKHVIMRFSDFKSNEYANLLGGASFEPQEENPMLGFRGTGRYISERFRPCFALECEAVNRVRHDMGLNNLHVMLPFVRTLSEAKKCIDLLAENGLSRNEKGLKVYMMCEVPSNVVLAEEFLALFDGFSIGSNDLTQLTLGIDRDSALLAEQFDEQNLAVKQGIEKVIRLCREQGKYVGICGQAPSDYPEFAEWLIEQGIGSISLTPDAVMPTILRLSRRFG